MTQSEFDRAISIAIRSLKEGSSVETIELVCACQELSDRIATVETITALMGKYCDAAQWLAIGIELGRSMAVSEVLATMEGV